jgi:spore coat polysaccharide biosynthesis protein SpsF
MARPAVILQARLASSRLPGKVLARVGSRTILEYCLLRLSISGLPLIVATTDQADDDEIEQEARAFGASVFRGDEHNVLARFIGAARAFNLTEVVRATADNPFVDPHGPRRVLALQHHVKADHVVERELPVGAAVEAVTVAALERSHAWITLPYDREHVTSFVRRDPRFRAHSAAAPDALRRPGLRLTVDTQEDLNFVRKVFASLGTDAPVASLAAVIQAAEAVPAGSVGCDRIEQGA